MSEFIFMLTHNDATVENARDVLEEVAETGLRCIGFKDVGAPREVLAEVTAQAHEVDMKVMLEIVDDRCRGRASHSRDGSRHRRRLRTGRDASGRGGGAPAGDGNRVLAVSGDD